MKKIILPIGLFLHLFLSCSIFDHRFDPLESGEYLFLIDSFYFYSGDNSSLIWDSYGSVDNEDLTIDISLPPSLDLNTESLIATISAMNNGTGDSEYYTFTTEGTVWTDNYTYLLSPNNFSTDWEGETFFEVEYEIDLNLRFLTSLNSEDPETGWGTSDTVYSSSDEFNFQLYFNDTADPSLLGETSFTNGFSGTNCDPSSALEGDSTFSSSNNYYYFTLNASAEGEGTLKLNKDSVYAAETTSGNIASDTVSFVYDATAPQASTVTMSATTNTEAPDSLSDIFFSLTYSQGKDEQIDQDDIQYLIVFSDDETQVSGSFSDVDTAFNNDTCWFMEDYWSYYEGTYNWDYLDDSSSELVTLLNTAYTEGSTEKTIYFNIVLKDYAYPGNSTYISTYLYSYGNMSLYSETPLAVTFLIPTD
jgi:hypothetical protein